MEARHHSELRRDFDAKLTPIRYDDLNSTQGESYTRLQPPTQQSVHRLYLRTHLISAISITAPPNRPTSHKIQLVLP